MRAPAPIATPDFHTALRFWWLLGWISFGGPAGQIAIMHAELVDRRRWIDEARFLAGLNYCMLLPGPEAQQLATYLGWSLHGVRGGLVAGGLFVLPSAVLLWALSWLYVTHGARPELDGVFVGLGAAVLALIAHAVLRLTRKVLKTPVAIGFAVVALLALAAGVPFPLLLAAAALVGVAVGRTWPSALPVAHAAGAGSALRGGGTRNAWLAAGACVALWLALVAAVVGAFGADATLGRMAVFFSQAALVTFGGAYAVLPYVAGHAVDTYGWLTTPQMIAGLGLAETTPGPLIMVLEFVGFVGAWQHPGALVPLAAATLAAALTVAVTFLPSFAFVFAGAPYIERLNRVTALRHALTAISAAVIGVIAHLAIWFAIATLWHDARVQWGALVLAAALFAWLVRRDPPVPLVVAAGIAGGSALQVFLPFAR